MKNKPAIKKATLSEAPYMFALVWLFFCSGALALVYEIIWQRQFALIFGAAAPATAAVLAAYFAGLGAGSFFVGKWAKNWTRPLRSYAILEVLIGVGALLVAPILTGFETIYPWLFERFAGSHGGFFAVKTLLVFVALAVPTFCMGGTLPVLGQWMDQGQHRLGITAGRLYVANTVGAGIGALLVPFLLLPLVGAQGALWICVSGNLLLAIVAWRMDKKLPVVTLEAPIEKKRTTTPVPESLKNPRTPLVLAAISGVVTFALQVFWNRAFAQVHENSVYSFAVMVAVIIFALATGAQLARMGLQRHIAPARLIGGAWLAGGVCLFMGPWLFIGLTNGLDYLPSDNGWASYALHLVGLILVVLFVPVTLLGVGLPAIMEQAGQRRDAVASQLLGRILSVNVAGSVVGALAAGFVLPRWLGQWSNILLLAVLLMLAGWWQLQSVKKTFNERKLLMTLAVVFLCSLWPISRVNLPRVRYASEQGEKLVSVKEGTHGVTAVIEKPGSRRLKLNNFYVLGGTAAAGDERMQTHLPLLLHPKPERVAVLGLGTGITASGAMFHPVKHLVAVELVPDVVDAARDYFSDANAGVLTAPRTQVVVEDARNYLRGTREKFDVIIGDLVVPWRQGEGSLFTLEHFQAAREALAPDGIFCQWLPLFQLSEAELQIILRTYLTVFPEAILWRGDFSPTEPAIALVGGRDTMKLQPLVIRERLKAMQPDPFNPHLASPVVLWMHYVGSLTLADLPANETRLNRENQPWVELLGPLQHAGGRSGGLFVGRRLQTWLNGVKQRASGSLMGLDTAEVSGVQSGDLLAELMLRMTEGDATAARRAQEELRKALPPEVFALLFPGM